MARTCRRRVSRKACGSQRGAIWPSAWQRSLQCPVLRTGRLHRASSPDV